MESLNPLLDIIQLSFTDFISEDTANSLASTLLNFNTTKLDQGSVLNVLLTNAKLEDRLHKYTNVIKWKTHVLHHRGFGGPSPWQCRPPRCRKFGELCDLDQRFHHLADIHQKLFYVAERRKRRDT